ncbi:MAG: DUF3127 domain-containing protein [Bacteroidaceae bacterium]|nr:DUF3127 domain-containing protein [Bacteroidaceae bacterium]
MEFTGRIIKALEPRAGVSSRTGNPWKMQDFVIEETVGQFPKRMVFNVFGEENLNRFNIQEGQELTISFDVNAREYNGRWFNDIRAWNVMAAAPSQPVAGAQAGVQPVAQAAQPAAPFPPADSAPSAQASFETSADDSSDLPF